MAEIELSVIAPVHNESKAATALAREIADCLKGRSFEIIFVDDASTDQTREELVALKQDIPQLRILMHSKNAGQSRAIRSGVLKARAPIIATLDGDGQNDPKDFPEMYRLLTRSDAPSDLAMIMGRRVNRQDSGWKKFGSRIGNGVRRRLLKDGSTDSGCGLKMMKRDVFLQLPYFDHMHRYIPALIQADGYGIEFIDVEHRSRDYGQSKYNNLGRLMAAISDLRGVMWLIKRRRDTGHIDEM